jgi:hypothetical protein
MCTSFQAASLGGGTAWTRVFVRLLLRSPDLNLPHIWADLDLPDPALRSWAAVIIGTAKVLATGCRSRSAWPWPKPDDGEPLLLGEENLRAAIKMEWRLQRL